jgi:hypothetical protein
MTTNRTALSAIAGIAMLVLPVSALAGHHHDRDDDPRPYAWHDQGRHRGWFKHHQQYAVRRAEDEDDEGAHSHLRPSEEPPAFLCDGDGDDCESNRGGWDDDDYGPPISYYRAAPAAGYNLVQQRNFLLDRRRRAYQVLGLMQARHDSHAVHRISTVIRVLNSQIDRDNQLLADRYPSPPVSYYAPVSNPGDYYSGQFNPGNGRFGYNPGYGYNPNSQAAPGLNALVGTVGPLLGLPSY